MPLPLPGERRAEFGSEAWPALSGCGPARAGAARPRDGIAPAPSAPREGVLAFGFDGQGSDGQQGERLGDHFRAWFGRSGQRYIVSVHALDGADPACEYDGALLFAVRRDAGGSSVLLDGRDSGAAGAAGRNAGWIAAMRQRGATELHVHLLARDPAARQRALFDLTA
ncbi:hypothetical protein ACERNI_03490 [Camelimonas sp. ID_303_24]